MPKPQSLYTTEPAKQIRWAFQFAQKTIGEILEEVLRPRGGVKNYKEGGEVLILIRALHNFILASNVRAHEASSSPAIPSSSSFRPGWMKTPVIPFVEAGPFIDNRPPTLDLIRNYLGEYGQHPPLVSEKLKPREAPRGSPITWPKFEAVQAELRRAILDIATNAGLVEALERTHGDTVMVERAGEQREINRQLIPEKTFLKWQAHIKNPLFERRYGFVCCRLIALDESRRFFFSISFEDENPSIAEGHASDSLAFKSVVALCLNLHRSGLSTWDLSICPICSKVFLRSKEPRLLKYKDKDYGKYENQCCGDRGCTVEAGRQERDNRKKIAELQKKLAKEAERFDTFLKRSRARDCRVGAPPAPFIKKRLPGRWQTVESWWKDKRPPKEIWRDLPEKTQDIFREYEFGDLS